MNWCPWLFALLAMAGLCSCDRISDSYATLDEARAARLFERGWLPDILPASSVDIKITTDVDTNTAIGSFRFKPGDFSELVAKMSPHVESRQGEAYLEYMKDGYIPYQYSNGAYTWLFFCKAEAAECKFRLE